MNDQGSSEDSDASEGEAPDESEKEVEAEVSNQLDLENKAQDELGKEDQLEGDRDDEPDSSMDQGDETENVELDPMFYGPNTPKKSRSGRRTSKVVPENSVWLYMKRLKPDAPIKDSTRKSAPTHICIREGCNMQLRMSYDKAKEVWLTTRAIDHNKQFHTDSASAKKSNLVEDKKADFRQSTMWNCGLNMAEGGNGSKGGDISSFFQVDPRDAALAAQARNFCYSKTALRKSTQDDEFHREMLQALYDAGGGKGKAPVLTSRGLEKWVKAEYTIFQKYIRFLLENTRDYSKGNSYSQVIHDHATLENKEKCLGIGIQFILPDLSENMVVCICLRPCSGGSAVKASDDICKIFTEVTGCKLKEHTHSFIQDYAALKTAEELGYAKEGCDMHALDKIGSVICGENKCPPPSAC